MSLIDDGVMHCIRHDLWEDFLLSASYDNPAAPLEREVSRLAQGAVRAVARNMVPQARADRIQSLTAAVVSPRADAWKAIVANMRADGLRMTDLIDVYVPAVARRLGADWVNDDAGFAQVTLGCARLRTILSWADLELDDLDLAVDIPHGTIWLLTPTGGQHRLGQQVLAAQLLRHGVAARVAVDPAAVTDADVVMISASGQEDTAVLRATVELARTMGDAPFVLLGGAAVELAGTRCLAAGADLVTDDLDLALSHCRRTPPGARVRE